MNIKKAVITAAGKSQRALPLQSLVDRDGATKTALRILVEEILSAGIEEIVIVICPGDEAAYSTAAGRQKGQITFIEQKGSAGYGQAVWCAREFTAAQHFLLLVGDHLYVSGSQKRSAQQLVEIAGAENCAVSAVQATHESKLPYYGAVGGRLVAGRKGLFEVTQVLEKPTPTEAEQKLIVPGLRAGHYLCFYGMHVLGPAAMDLLESEISRGGNRPVSLSATLDKLAQRERYLACELQGHRYDIGVKYGLLTAQLALALDGNDRDEVLSGLVELLAKRQTHM
ncbi:MAG: UTP--glucose-1-phosphate uridylyltransferase [Verrucomicrobia bacterium]|nr:MAG: UTP--glucose-1-phosphate uridylyltransferase [Verrucomicrobiota bacterium]